MPLFEKHYKRILGKPGVRCCNLCNTEVKYENSHKHSSNLRNHLKTKHSEVLDAPPPKIAKITEFVVPSSSANQFPDLTPIDRQVIAACCSKHVLPYDIVEDEIFRWAYSCHVKSRKKIADRVDSMAEEWREIILKELDGSFVTLLLDGWTDSINKNHHVCFLLWNGKKIFYWKSVVLKSKSANDFRNVVQETVFELRPTRIIAAVADNARNIQKGLQMVNDHNPQILNVKCSAHLLNLVTKDVLSKVDIAQDAMKDVDQFVRIGSMSRYSETRWLGRYDGICTAVENKFGNDVSQIRLEQTKQILSDVSNNLNIVQKDSANFIDVVKAFSSIKNSWNNNPGLSSERKKILSKIFENRWSQFLHSSLGYVISFLKEVITELTQFSNMFEPLNEQEETIAMKWITGILPSTKLETFKEEEMDLKDLCFLREEINLEKFPAHRFIVSLLKKISISEAAVERAFSRHKLIHTRLRANLKSESMDNQLFIRYNFGIILKVAERENAEIEYEKELLGSLSDDSE